MEEESGNWDDWDAGNSPGPSPRASERSPKTKKAEVATPSREDRRAGDRDRDRDRSGGARRGFADKSKLAAHTPTERRAVKQRPSPSPVSASGNDGEVEAVEEWDDWDD